MTTFYGFRHGTERSKATEHNVQIGIVAGLVSRSVPPPAAPKVGPGDNISSTPEPWQPFAYGITDLQTAEAVTLHPLDLLRREKGVRQESVAVEHGVIDPLHVCFEEPHGIFRHPTMVPEAGK